MLLWRAPRETILAGVPGVAIVAAAFFGTNWIAHDRISPPYAFRSDTDASENWYAYTYTVNGREVKSYWLDRKGIDRGEPSKVTYAIHALVGHHGIFSLTPIWLISLAGAVMWLKSPDPQRRELSAAHPRGERHLHYFFHRLSTFGGPQLWGHDERLPLGLLVRTALADRHDSRRRPARSFHDRPGRGSCPPVVFRSLGQLSNLESLDAALVV